MIKGLNKEKYDLNNGILNEKRKALNSELSATLYISDKKNQIIIAPEYLAKGIGCHCEQEVVQVMRIDVSDEEIGAEVIKALYMFDVKKIDLKNRTLKDWAAYQSSGEKTKRKFEEEYIKINISTYHPCFYIRMSGHPKGKLNEGITVETIFSIIEPRTIGLNIKRIYNASLRCEY